MRVLLTSRGLPVFIDTRDHEWLSQFDWHVSCTGSKFYAHTEGGVYMHRLILGLVPGDEKMGDHRNGCTVDNRRRNLRVVSARQNCYNLHTTRDNETGYTGVSRYGVSRFQARGRNIDGRRVSLGYFDTPVEAAEAYARNFALVAAHIMGAISNDTTGATDTISHLQTNSLSMGT